MKAKAKYGENKVDKISAEFAEILRKKLKGASKELWSAMECSDRVAAHLH